MADLANLLLRTVARAFYHTEHALVIDALITHSTLSETDLKYVLNIPHVKTLRKLCGRLREDGLLSVETRAEKRTDGSDAFYGSGGPGQQGKERLVHRDWYYLNYHHAIDSIKYRMYKLNKHVESLGASTTEKKDLSCSRCKSQYTDLEVLDNVDAYTGHFLCKRCGYVLDPIMDNERAGENEIMKRLNSQLDKILRLMQQIDAATVPENDFQTALSRQKPVIRDDANPGQQRTEVVDLPAKGLQSAKGLAIKPERIAVQVQDDETVKRENEASEAQARREKEARQNALPEWIERSTLTGDLTAVGAKEQRLKAERAVNAADAVKGDAAAAAAKADKDGLKDSLDALFKDLARTQAEEAARAAQLEDDEDDDDDDDDDEFEDVDFGRGSGSASVAVDTPPAQASSSNVTDDERKVKRVRIEEPSTDGSPSKNVAPVAEGTPAASDEDEDDLEFENV